MSLRDYNHMKNSSKSFSPPPPPTTHSRACRSTSGAKSSGYDRVSDQRSSQQFEMYRCLLFTLHSAVVQDHGRGQCDERNRAFYYGRALAVSLQHFVPFVYLPGKEELWPDRSTQRAGDLQVHYCLRRHILLPCSGGDFFGGVQAYRAASLDNGLAVSVCFVDHHSDAAYICCDARWK